MQLAEISIRRPVFATVLSLLIVLVGAVSFNRLAVREYPKIDEPVVTVSVRYAGASAEVIESQVTKPLEDSTAGIDGVDVITSIRIAAALWRSLGWFRFAGALAGGGAAIALIFPTMKQELSPLEDRGVILVNVNAPDGAMLEYTNRYAQALEEMGKPFKEFDRIFANVGNPTVAQASVVYRTVDWDDRKRSTIELARELQPQFDALRAADAG